jgi:double-stranded uracil-DNA glycosylase
MKSESRRHESPALAMRVECFPPVVAANSQVLILGSMPGAASLAAGQYYAHPRNAFWSIMAAILFFDVNAPYLTRLAALKRARIALWDVIHTCNRPGSLDADIDPTSLIPNDFANFFRAHPQIMHVFFNGAAAERCYRRFVLPVLEGRSLGYTRLPSTSPAHAALGVAEKLHRWQVVGR